MKLDIDFQNKKDVFLLLDIFEKFSHEILMPRDATFKVMGETNFIQALAHLNFQLNGDPNESKKI